MDRQKTSLESFASRVIAIDAYNAIYQFLATIRGSDGQNLSDLRGNVTSHLSGLLHRNVNFLSMGIQPIYIFDGKPPSLKAAEIERRRLLKTDAAVRYEKAISSGDVTDARKYAQRITYLTDGMVDESKTLLSFFGIPYISAPSEGEATAAHLNRIGVAYASASQDYDSILFGAKTLIRNFTISGRRKLPNKNAYIYVEPEIIDVQKSLDLLGVTQEQMVDIGILIGTDFNPDGFRGVGAKTALKLIRRHSRLEDIPSIQDSLEQIDYQQIRNIFLKPMVANVDKVEFGSVDYDGVLAYLTGRSFDRERVQASLNRLKKSLTKRSNNLDRWL